MSPGSLSYVQEAFETNWIAPVGPHLEVFEKTLADKVGVKHAAAVATGTAAIHLALRLLDIGAGDEVVCSTLTFVASVNPILQQGARPVFVDSDDSSWNMDPALLRELLERKAALGRLPKAVIVVHLYGQSADMDPIMAVCDEFQIPVIEDAAEALGATYWSNLSDREVEPVPIGQGEKVKSERIPAGKHAVSPGTMGRFGIYSFNGNKIITTSGGGMLVSNDEEAIGRARFLATQARDPAPHYEHTTAGYNYRMSNVLAGIGRGQLEVLDERVDARRRVFSRYESALAELPGVTFMPEAEFGRSTRWLTCLTVDPTISGGVTSQRVRLSMEQQDIEARPVWKPMHRQPLFAGAEIVGGAISDRLFKNGLCLPSGSNLTGAEVDRVIACFRSHWNGKEESR